jgi:GAF domain-containing protein
VQTLKTGESISGVVIGIFNNERKEYHWVIMDTIPKYGVIGKELQGVTVLLNDITEYKCSEEALQTVFESAAGVNGQDFFDNVVINLSKWLALDCVIMGCLQDEKNVKVMSMQMDGKLVYEFEYCLHGTPCENVAKEGFCVYPSNICELFPEDKILKDFKAQGYVGIPVKNRNGIVLGILCGITRKKLNLEISAEKVMGIIAARAAVEIEHIQAGEKLKEKIEELENFTDIAVRRELRMSEINKENIILKKEIEKLKKYELST